MPASTPISLSKTAALSRVSDSVSKGYVRYVGGSVSVDKAARMIWKLHERHEVGATPGRRAVRKASGQANAVLSIYWPEEATSVEWMMLFTPGELNSPEPQLREAAEKPRPQWLGYELVRRAGGGKSGAAAAWTWRRPAAQVAEHYALLSDAANRHSWSAVGGHLEVIARQPGFHGVREQSKKLFAEARRRGYAGELPTLYYLQKVAHGERFDLSPGQQLLPFSPACRSQCALPDAGPIEPGGISGERPEARGTHTVPLGPGGPHPSATRGHWTSRCA
jgi:hypothetical protein